MTAPNYTLVTTTATTVLTTINATDNMTYVLLKEKEIRYIRDFPMADGINVLGEMVYPWPLFYLYIFTLFLLINFSPT
jgi:hypothetical protein